jgi:hypothetical protein
MKIFASRSALFALIFTGTDLYQPKNITFPNVKAKASVVVFLSAKCPCSASHEPVLKSLATQYSKDGFEFIAVHSNQNETPAETKEHFKCANLGFLTIEDRGAKIANDLKALKTPHAYIIQNGKIVYEGGVDDSADAGEATNHYLSNALQELKDNKPISVAKTRSLGCQIKR